LSNKLPRHVAIVMDGNGRWAERLGQLRVEGHRAGVNSVKAVIRSCLEQGIAVLSLFAFSSENWSRPVPEVEFLMQLFLDALSHEIESLHDHGIQLRFTGDRSGLSDALQLEMHRSEQLTSSNQSLILNIVINYGGKWDIVQAVRALASQVALGQLMPADIDEKCFSEALNTGLLPDPDLLIRTSGEQRISNFFLWQLAYTELYFSEVLWPDFNAEEFDKALFAYSQRKRRYGKVPDCCVAEA
jgi:undecaprenyl diphosphate synthase